MNTNEALDVFRLPCGYRDKEGVLHRTFKVKPITGIVEEKITDEKIRGNGAKVITELIVNCAYDLGTIGKITREIAREMDLGDRNFIVLKIRIASLGKDIEVIVKCPNCREISKEIVDLNKIEVDTIPDDAPREIEFVLKDGVEWEGKIHKKGVLRFSNGIDQEAVFSSGNSGLGTVRTAILARCLKKLGDIRLISTEIVRRMTIRDRNYLQGLMLKLPGPNLTLSRECFSCGQNFEVPIPIADFFTNTGV
jgi:hypothetical protein